MHSLFDLFLFRHFKLSTHCYLLSTQTHRQMLRPQHQKLISTFMLNNPFLSPASLLHQFKPTSQTRPKIHSCTTASVMSLCIV